MRTIDPKWSGLAEGYRAVHSLEDRLEREFGRAVEVGYRQEHLHKLAEWKRKRRVFFALLVLAPLSIVTLCVAAFQLKDVACVLVYWAVLIVIILVTLGVSGWGFIKDATNRPRMQAHAPTSTSIEMRWWQSLALGDRKQKKGEKLDLDQMLGDRLPDDFLAGGGLVLSENGMWLFTSRDWQGAIGRDEDGWKLLRKKQGTVFPGQAPDLEWLEKKKALVAVVTEQLPQAAWVAEKMQGGIVFTNLKGHPDTDHLRGNTAAYGSVKAWVSRMQKAPVLEGFPLPVQLEVLDALRERPSGDSFSAKEQADRLFQQITSELRESVGRMVG